MSANIVICRMKNKDKILQQFANNLREIRKAKELSQEALADKAGFDRTYISLLERGMRNLSLVNICRLAEALDVNINELLIDL